MDRHEYLFYATWFASLEHFMGEMVNDALNSYPLQMNEIIVMDWIYVILQNLWAEV